jgi:hypothetical protein
MGHLIPAGTGYDEHRRIALDREILKIEEPEEVAVEKPDDEDDSEEK